MATQIRDLNRLSKTSVVTERDEDNNPKKRAWFLYDQYAPWFWLVGESLEFYGRLIGEIEFTKESIGINRSIPPIFYKTISASGSITHSYSKTGRTSIRTVSGSITYNDNAPPTNELQGSYTLYDRNGQVINHDDDSNAFIYFGAATPTSTTEKIFIGSIVGDDMTESGTVSFSLSNPDTEEAAIARSDHPDGQEGTYTQSDYPYRTGREISYTKAKVAFYCRHLYPEHRYVLQYDIEEYIHKDPADAAREAKEKEDMDADAAAAYDEEIAELDAEAGIGVWKKFKTEKQKFTAPERKKDEDGNYPYLVDHIVGGTKEEKEDEDGNTTTKIKANIELPFEKGKAYRTANVIVYPEYARILDVPEEEEEEEEED